MVTFVVKTMWQYMFSPRLVKLYGNGPVEKLYEPSALENLGDRVLQSLYIMWKIGIYTTPLLAGFLYRRGYFEKENHITLTKFVSLIGGIIVVSYVIRGIGRATNPMYRQFISALTGAKQNFTPSAKQKLSEYDFEFYAWPVEFDVLKLDRDDIKDRIYIKKPSSNKSLIHVGATLPCHIIGYVLVHTFGIKMVYPGSIGLLQSILAQGLLQGRSKLIEVNGGVRYKLKASGGNEIDAMFVDKRNSRGNGSTLVICCEGNAGFYEMGIMSTPILGGYSVLGWNHPGFGGSTGTPYPVQELDAMDAVMLFAIHKLGFKPENIVLFGWSIGGFTTTWAAMNYPDIKGLILDASFDDIMPLALNQMPTWAESIVRLAVREYLNLNNYEQLVKYPGPVLFIRRMEDEVICTTMGEIETNRGNYLLAKLLKYRYPLLTGNLQLKAMKEYLSLSSPATQEIFANRHDSNGTWCMSYLETYFSENPKTYPSNIGDELSEEKKTNLIIYLVRKYMKDYKTTHCTPLPIEMFQMPWDISIENDFVHLGPST